MDKGDRCRESRVKIIKLKLLMEVLYKFQKEIVV